MFTKMLYVKEGHQNMTIMSLHCPCETCDPSGEYCPSGDPMAD